MDNDTRTLLGLTDPNLTFPEHWLKLKLVKQVICAYIECQLTYTPKACPKCGVINYGQIKRYGFHTVHHKYGQFRNQPLILEVNTQRFYCPDCQHTFSATSSLFTPHKSVSVNLRREIIQRLCKVATIKDIAHNLAISEVTVQHVLLDVAKEIQPQWNYLPQTLCIDEFKSMRSAAGKMSFIAIDGDHHCLFEIVENRQLKSQSL